MEGEIYAEVEFKHLPAQGVGSLIHVDVEITKNCDRRDVGETQEPSSVLWVAEMTTENASLTAHETSSWQSHICAALSPFLS